MESNLVNENFDDSPYVVHPKEAVNLVENYLFKNLPQFKIVSKFIREPFWGIIFENNRININFSGDAGFSIVIKIGNEEYQLWQYDRSVGNCTGTNSKNILYQLEVLSKFIADFS
jgi:hypothetical protein